MNQSGVKITLREVEARDWRAIHDYASREEACKYQPWGPNSEDETREYVQ
jgi:hypothetical protein